VASLAGIPVASLVPIPVASLAAIPVASLAGIPVASLVPIPVAAIPVASLAAIKAIAINPFASVVDVGGGASTLVDDILTHGLADVTVVDLSQRALDATAARLAAKRPRHRGTFVNSDIREWQPDRTFDIWHDRAAYQFLTDAQDQQRYWELVRAHVPGGGHVVIATFAEDGLNRVRACPFSATAQHN
jgi:SAM-dependent methyltransferase